jgi:predicted RNase H-like HicB family nuclease
MINKFLEKKMKSAKYKILEDNTYFGEIPRFKGVWANADNLEDCRCQLKEVLEDWILLKVRDHENIPGLKIKFDRRRLAQEA